MTKLQEEKKNQDERLSSFLNGLQNTLVAVLRGQTQKDDT